ATVAQQSELDLVARQSASALEPQCSQQTGRGVIALVVRLEQDELALAQHGEVPDAGRVDEEMEREQRYRLGQHVRRRMLDRREGAEGGAKLGDAVTREIERRGGGGPCILSEEIPDPGRSLPGLLAELDVLEPERTRRGDACFGIRFGQHRRRLEAPGPTRRRGGLRRPARG